MPATIAVEIGTGAGDEFYVAGVLADPGLFGVTPTGRPYHDTVAVDGGDEAVIDVDAAGVFLEA